MPEFFFFKGCYKLNRLEEKGSVPCSHNPSTHEKGLSGHPALTSPFLFSTHLCVLSSPFLLFQHLSPHLPSFLVILPCSSLNLMKYSKTV